MSGERSVALNVDDMLECIEKIEKYCAGVTADEFAANSLLQDAVTRRLRVIGEAAKRVPQRVRSQHPDIPWRKIAEFGGMLVHQYPVVLVDRVWQVVIVDLLPVKPLLLQVQAHLERVEQKESG